MLNFYDIPITQDLDIIIIIIIIIFYIYPR